MTAQYHTVNSIDDLLCIEAMWQRLTELPPHVQNEMWIRQDDTGIGNICLYRDERYQGRVLEYVWGTKDDSVTTLYQEHPTFATRQSLIDFRRELMGDIGARIGTLPSVITIYDTGRSREAHLRELGTMQLIDLYWQI